MLMEKHPLAPLLSPSFTFTWPYSAGSLAGSVAVRSVNRNVTLASCSSSSFCSEESERFFEKKDGFGRKGALVTDVV